MASVVEQSENETYVEWYRQRKIEELGGGGGALSKSLFRPTQIPTWSGLEFNSVICGDRRWRRWLRHCTTIRKVVGSIPGGIIGILHWHTPSGRTMVMGPTPPVTEISTRHISCGVKTAAAGGWQLYHFHVPIVLKSGSLYLLKSSWPVPCCTFFASAIKGRRLPEPWYIRAPFFLSFIKPINNNFRLRRHLADWYYPSRPKAHVWVPQSSGLRSRKEFLGCLNMYRTFKEYTSS